MRRANAAATQFSGARVAYYNVTVIVKAVGPFEIIKKKVIFRHNCCLICFSEWYVI